MTADFSERYRNPEFVNLWRADKGLEAARSFWRHRLISVLPFEPEKSNQGFRFGRRHRRINAGALQPLPKR